MAKTVDITIVVKTVDDEKSKEFRRSVIPNEEKANEFAMLIKELIENYSPQIIAKLKFYAKLNSEPLECLVTDVLQKMGFATSSKGYKYLRTAIILAITDMDAINLTMKKIYIEVANVYATGWVRVHNNIETSIKYAFERGNKELFAHYLGATCVSYKPPTGEFIKTIADRIRLEMK